MPKKIFDIFPPQTPATLPSKKSLLFLEKEESISLPPSPERKKSWPRWVGGILIVLIILILAGVSLSFTLSKAEIEIWPEVELLEFEKEITVNVKMTKTDPTLWLKQRVIPGEFISQEKESSQQFFSSGITEKKEKAKGQIRVYNKYSLPTTLISGTHFMSDSGKQFHSLKQITIPAKGYIDVEAEADESGEEYNIKPSKFSVPGLRKYSQELFYNIWAESFSPMTGGSIGKVAQVTQKDLETAESTLVDKLLKDGENSLKNMLPSDSILLDGVLRQEVIEKSSLAKPGQELESFIYRAKINSKALIFKKTDLESFVKQFLYSQMTPAQKLYEESLSFKTIPKVIDLESGKITLSLEFSAKIYPDIDLAALEQEIRGKPLSEVDVLLRSYPEFIKTKVNFFPFWIRKAPENLEKIDLKLNLDAPSELQSQP